MTPSEIASDTSETPVRGPRVVLYSHDTFGLGHLRRSRALAEAITASDPSASALILTGSPVAGRFAFPTRVDHVRLPGVIKRSDGSYASRTLGMGIEETTELRANLILSTVETYAPDILIVDKEPCGFRGELLPTLPSAQTRPKSTGWSQAPQCSGSLAMAMHTPSQTAPSQLGTPSSHRPPGTTA